MFLGRPVFVATRYLEAVNEIGVQDICISRLKSHPTVMQKDQIGPQSAQDPLRQLRVHARVVDLSMNTGDVLDPAWSLPRTLGLDR